MERIRVSLPESFPFSTTIKVRITDLNYGGHVGNYVFLSLVHEARQQFLLQFGYKELEFAGAGLIMVDSAIEYKRELSYGEEVKISVCATNFNKLGFDLYYLLEVIEGNNNVVAGKVKTGMLCYDYNLKKKVSVPAVALERMQSAFW